MIFFRLYGSPLETILYGFDDYRCPKINSHRIVTHCRSQRSSDEAAAPGEAREVIHENCMGSEKNGMVKDGGRDECF